MMMCLGLFVFSLQTAAYQELQRKTSWKHATNSRVGTRDATQFTGVGEDTITLSGWIAPELTGTAFSCDALRLMADTGKSWVLVQGTGRIYGTFVITDMTEGRTIFKKNGEAQRIEFSITLLRTDEGMLSMLQGLGDIAGFSNLADMSGLTRLGQLAGDIGNKVGGLVGKIL